MSSERRREPAPGPSRRPRAAGGSPVARRDTAQGAAREGAASRGRALGYDPDDPATWPGAQQETAAPAAPAPGDGEGAREAPKELTDAKGMRALAHPVRLSLIDLFSYHETLTATQASDLLGESPANCAFHLRTLAKYGFVREAGGGRGRERPWTLVNRVVRINSRQADPQAALAADELSRVMLERWIERARQALGAPNTVPGWSRGLRLVPGERVHDPGRGHGRAGPDKQPAWPLRGQAVQPGVAAAGRAPGGVGLVHLADRRLGPAGRR